MECSVFHICGACAGCRPTDTEGENANAWKSEEVVGDDAEGSAAGWELDELLREHRNCGECAVLQVFALEICVYGSRPCTFLGSYRGK